MHQLGPSRVGNLDVLWITSDLKKIMFRRDYLKKRAAKVLHHANRVNYKIKASKNRYFSHNLEINKGNSKNPVEIVE
jgi:hypothetical protein